MLQGQITVLERSKGVATASFGLRAGKTCLQDLSQSGSARILLPRTDTGCPEVVFLNTSGGLTSGDRLRFGLTLAAGSKATATTQTAERAYHAATGPAYLSVRAEVGLAGHLAWLPQETILFEDCHLQRDTHVALAQGATCLMAEIIVLGRRAMGERPQRARLTDRRMVTMGGQPLWAEALRLDDTVLAHAHRPAVLAGNAAFATIALLGQGAEDAAPCLHSLAPSEGVETAISGWNGRCLIRAMARDLWPLKQWLGRAIAQLSASPLPRVWQMQGVSP